MGTSPHFTTSGQSLVFRKIPSLYFEVRRFPAILLVGAAFLRAAPLFAAWNPSVLNVPWESDYSAIVGNEINAKTDSRLSPQAVGDNTTDDYAAIQGALNLASTLGGGVVYLPTGNYKVIAQSDPVASHPLSVPSNVILRGDGPLLSVIYVNNLMAPIEDGAVWHWGGISFVGASVTGMTDLGVQLVNPSTSSCAVLWDRASNIYTRDMFLNNMMIQLNKGKNVWIDNRSNFLIQNSTINSSSIDYGPIYVVANATVAFINNSVFYNYGRVQAQENSGLLVQGNTFVRDAQGNDMDNGTAIESGGIELSFGTTLQILNNTFETLNAPTSELGDGETIMSQHSNGADFQDFGAITAVSANSLTDTAALWSTNTTTALAQYPGEIIAIASGPAAGEWRNLASIDTVNKILTVSPPWNPMPLVGSLYSMTRWTLAYALIQGNTLINNPNGIEMYDGCLNCTVDNNTIYDSRAIWLRVVDENYSNPDSRRIHEVAEHNRITNNKLFSTGGYRGSMVFLDIEAFHSGGDYKGLGIYDTQMGGNAITPYPSNPSVSYPNGALPSQDGFYPCYIWGPAGPKDPTSVTTNPVATFKNVLTQPVTLIARDIPLADTSCVTSTAIPSLISPRGFRFGP